MWSLLILRKTRSQTDEGANELKFTYNINIKDVDKHVLEEVKIIALRSRAPLYTDHIKSVKKEKTL